MLKRIAHKAIQFLTILSNHESMALLIGLSVLAGTLTFFRVTIGVVTQASTHWMWLALVATLLILPHVYRKLKSNEEPYIILCARAFQEGFLYAWLFMVRALTQQWWQDEENSTD